MSNPYRDMITQLAAALQQQVFRDPEMDGNDLPRQAQELLAQPEPPDLTDEELDEMVPAYYRGAAFKCYREGLAAGLRWAQAAPQPDPPELTDEEIAKAAREALDSYRYSTELPYFLDEHASEYEPIMRAFRAVIAAADRARRP